MFTGITLPFTASEMVSGAFELIGLLGPYIIIALAIMLAPRIISIIKGAIGRGGSRT